jgi:hypothetical protein
MSRLRRDYPTLLFLLSESPWRDISDLLFMGEM